MPTGSREQEQTLRTLGGVRSALQEFRLATQGAMAEHERLAGRYARQGDRAAAWMERRAAAVQRQRLADVDAALDSLEAAVSAALDLDS